MALSHDLVYDLVVVLVELGLVVAFLVAQDAQALRALQLNFELLLDQKTQMKPKRQRNYQRKSDVLEIKAYLIPLRLRGVSEHTGLGFANKVAEGIHFKCAVQIWTHNDEKK